MLAGLKVLNDEEMRDEDTKRNAKNSAVKNK